MTDADTLLTAYFREEFCINPQQARLLLAFWRARRPLSPEQLAEIASVRGPSAKTVFWRLRDTLGGPRWIATIRQKHERGQPGHYVLTPYARAEIARMLGEAIGALSAECQPQTRRAA